MNTPVQMALKGLLPRPSMFSATEEQLDPTRMFQTIAALISQAKIKLRIASADQKKYLDNKKTFHIFRPGDFAYMENPMLGKPGFKSMDARYFGPFEIIAAVGASSFQLDLPRHMSRRFSTIHESKLTPFKDRETGLCIPTAATRIIPLSLEETEDNEEEETYGERRCLDVRVKKVQNFNYAEMLVSINGVKSWKRVGGNNGLISSHWWKQIYDFCSSSDALKKIYPLMQLVKCTVLLKNVKKTMLGYVVRSSDQVVKKPYVVEFQDSTTAEDITEKELKADAEAAIYHNSDYRLNLCQSELDEDWVFPGQLSGLYAVFSGRYTLDAMEHRSGKNAKAERFCSLNRSVFSYNLARNRVWCNPPRSMICKFLKYFQYCYKKCPAHTSLTLVLPIIMEHHYWKMIEGFRIIDVIPHMPGVNAAVMVLYFGPNFEVSKSKVMHKKCGSDIKLYKRLKKIIDGNYIFSGDQMPNMELINYILKDSTLKSEEGGKSEDMN